MATFHGHIHESVDQHDGMFKERHHERTRVEGSMYGGERRKRFSSGSPARHRIRYRRPGERRSHEVCEEPDGLLIKKQLLYVHKSY